MSLFIQPENQNILWETILKNKIFQSIFPDGSPQERKNNWFKNHIQQMYQKLPPAINKQNLYDINRNAITIMMNDLKKMDSERHSTIVSQVLGKMDNRMGIFSRMEETVDKKSGNYNLIENNYRNMFEVPKPKQIDFSEKIEDEVITNMQELIEQQKKMREQEMNLFSPPLQKEKNESNRLNILEDVSNITVEPLSIQLPSELKKEKRVHFLQDDLFSEMEELKKKMENMDSKIDELFSFCKNMFQQKSAETAEISRAPENCDLQTTIDGRE